MTTFPETVYKVPGIHRGYRGNTFSFAPVNSAEELAALEAEGWHLKIEDAIAAANKPADVVAVVVADIDGDLREALEAEAKALGVSFNSRTSDKTLSERIEAAR